MLVLSFGGSPQARLEELGSWKNKVFRSVKVLGEAPRKLVPAAIERQERDDRTGHRDDLKAILQQNAEFAKQNSELMQTIASLLSQKAK